MTGRIKYTKSGDVALTRKISLGVFKLEILPHIKEHWSPKGEGCIIDVGCGNGRFNIITHNYFNKVIGLDLFWDGFDDPCKYDNCEFHKSGLIDFEYDGKVDCIMFYASFYVIGEYKELLNKCYDLLNDGGVVVIADAKKRRERLTTDYDYDLDKLAASARFEIKQEFIQKSGVLYVAVLGKE